MLLWWDVAMEADQASGEVGTMRWSTAALCTLAFVAAANLAVTGFRLASTGVAGRSWIRLGVEIAAAVIFPLLAVWQLRKGGRSDPVAVPWREDERERPRTSHRKWLLRAQWLLAPILIVVAFVSISGQWDTVTDAIGQLAHLHWRYVRLAVYAEALSTISFASLGWVLLRARGARLTLRSMIALSLASNALSVSIPAGQALAATFSFDQLRRRGVGRGTAVRVLVSMLVVVSAVLVLLLAIGVELAGDHGPAAPFRVAVALIAAAVVVLGGLAVFSRRVHWPRWAPGPRALLPAAGAALGNWITDCACLAAAILAAGGHVPWSALLAVYAVGQVAENLPITPGGVGVVEGTLSVLLVAYGMHATTAVTAVLVYRIISFWVQVPLGLAVATAMHLRRRPQARRASARERTDVIPAAVAS
ncbi:MAG TPA: YbhN family protein [Solirubrobacteraceae bacterium]|nr:YbhN family protein [Solirubrobacteraceae bacterium]